MNFMTKYKIVAVGGIITQVFTAVLCWYLSTRHEPGSSDERFLLWISGINTGLVGFSSINLIQVLRMRHAQRIMDKLVHTMDEQQVIIATQQMHINTMLPMPPEEPRRDHQYH